MIQESYSITSPKTTIFLGLRGLFLMPNLDISMDLYNTLIVSCAYGLNKSRARSILRLNQKLRTLWRRKQDIETPKILYFFNDMSNQKSFRSVSKTHSFNSLFHRSVATVTFPYLTYYEQWNENNFFSNLIFNFIYFLHLRWDILEWNYRKKWFNTSKLRRQ